MRRSRDGRFRQPTRIATAAGRAQLRGGRQEKTEERKPTAERGMSYDGGSRSLRPRR